MEPKELQVELQVELLMGQMQRWMKQRKDCNSKLRALSLETRRWERWEILGKRGATVGLVLLAVVFFGYVSAYIFSVLGFVFISLGALLEITKRFHTGELRKATEDSVGSSEVTLSRIRENFEFLRRCLREDLEEDEGEEEERAAVIEEILSYFAKDVGFNVDDLDFSAIIESYSSSSDTPSSSSSRPSFLQRCVLKILKILGLLDGMNLKAPVKTSGKRATHRSYNISPSFRASNRGQDVTSCVDSRSQRNKANVIQKDVDDLQKAMQDISSALEELKDVLECIEDPGCVCRRTKLLNYAQRHCRDPDVKEWLQEGAQSEHFLHLIDVFYHLKSALQREKKKRRRKDPRRLIDVVFVAHGWISDSLMFSNLLLPLPSLQEVVLYEPWNCVIDATAAYGIATGYIEPKHRSFVCWGGCQYRGFVHEHYPDGLPADWNHLRASRGEPIPEIWVETLRRPVDPAWGCFKILRSHCKIRHERVVVPFILPGHKELKMPFTVVTLALSLALLFTRLKARLHLAACLGRDKPLLELDRLLLQAQYCYTLDHTMMRCTPLARFSEENLELFNLLRGVFTEDHRLSRNLFYGDDNCSCS
ncbi:hypothetical protein NL108_016895 [Boleophthalmus pectinirostris]|uniref:uncharacterized protein LOC110174983 n=1 Tax=Boleophthalmus pectinirostris TaxID=150288 RepID=UPI0024300B4E|nr:uncharacterized protein LOC110174983 [Boleophthalmus pectinirostris]XP_055004843.1 uncharacterized protein LOC110174983 [Boleophthalmus pectinirostris]XP_055004848.1 uncharacterized protein LOC110174983 [Boleophthalmus pectinirostris]KAJ0070622.1 hypothetical protein NL108_016895 [Boleophthalmus pectinirostris]